MWVFIYFLRNIVDILYRAIECIIKLTNIHKLFIRIGDIRNERITK